MIADAETVPLRDGLLTFLDDVVDELFHAPALDADNVIVMAAVIEFEHRAATLEIVPLYETGGLELGEDPVHGSQADILARIEERPVDFLSRHVEFRITLQDAEDFYSRQRDFESGLSEISIFHFAAPWVCAGVFP